MCAMPASGRIRLMTCDATCNSIGCAVCGALQTPTSLIKMSNAAGKAHCMTAFYSYAGSTNKSVGIVCIAGTGVGTLGTSADVSRTNCICVNPAMSVGQSVCISFTNCLKTSACAGAVANYCIIRNGSTVVSCQVASNTACNVSASFTLSYGDTACVINCAHHGTPGAAQSCSCILACATVNIVGFFAIGAAQSCCVNSC